MSKDTPDFHREMESKRNKRIEKISRREWMKYSLAGGVGLLASAGYVSFEAQWLEVCEKEIMLKRLHPESNLRLLHLSDLHLSQAVSLDYLESALKKGLEQSPDACFLTGDFITDQPSKEDLIAYQKLLGFFAARVPTYACLGNHDGGSWAAEHGGFNSPQKIKSILKAAKIRVLDNETEQLYIKGQQIEIAGLGDLWSENCRPHDCLKRNSELPKNKKSKPLILLNHNPDAKKGLSDYNWDLMLCGHTHGGQFRVPYENSTPFAPVQDRSMVEGSFNWKGRVIHITRGVGNLYGIRLNCRPEISLLKVSGIS